MKKQFLLPSLLVGLPVAAILLGAVPAMAQAVPPVEEVSCGSLTLASAQQMFRDKGKTRVQVAGVFGKAATSGAAQKHTLLLQPGFEYLFIPGVYNDGEIVPTERRPGYNLRLRVTATAKNKELVAYENKQSAGGRPMGDGISVKKGTVVELDYEYTANGPDRADNCLTMMVIAQPK